MRLRLDATATGVAEPDSASLGLRVWALPEERVVFAVNTWASRLELPRTGPFHLDVDLHMNVGPGLYRIQGVVWRRPEGTEWTCGPSLVIRVEHGQLATYGSAWLSPTIRLIKKSG